ncbi:hypothetical protein H0H92_008416, partial [Tricholoma furcatifolium]
VPKDELWNLSKEHPRRSADEAYKLFRQAEKANKTHRDNWFKSLGLRFIENAFWGINNSDPHAALSFDELHNNSHGLGGKHLFKEAKRVIKNMKPQASREAASIIGEQ